MTQGNHEQQLEVEASMIWLEDEAVSFTGKRAKLSAWAGDDPERRRVADRVARAWSATPEAQQSKRRLGSASGLIAILLLVMGVYFQSEIAIAISSDHSSGTEILRGVSIAEGLVLDLDAKTAVSHDSQDGKVTITLLRGETFVTVDPTRELEVEVRAGDLTTSVTGTAFSVGLGEDGIAVSVAEGQVMVSADSLSATPVDAGTTVEWVGSTLSATSIPTRDVAAWRDGWIIAQDRALAELVEELDRYFPGTIIVTGSSLDTARVTGNFRADNPQEALEAMAAPYGAEVTRITPWLMILAAP